MEAQPRRPTKALTWRWQQAYAVQKHRRGNKFWSLTIEPLQLQTVIGVLNKTWKHQRVYCDSVGTSKLQNFSSYVDLKITIASPLPHFTAQLK